ncbi:MAG: alpha/beta hydrolase [Microthrixaceae bacterium]
MSREIRLRLLMATILPAAVALVGACAPLPPAATEPVDQVAPRPALADPDAVDVPYGTLDSQVLDIYRTTSSLRRGTIVFVHGGGWTSGDKQVIGQGALEAVASQVERGFDLVSINYRLAPQDPFPAALDDVALAIDWVRTDGSADHGLDASRVVVVGHSAGGSLAAMIGTSPGSPTEFGRIPRVDAWVSISAMSAYEAGGMLDDFPRNWGLSTSAARIAASPITTVDPTDPPGHLVHGDRDGIVQSWHSVVFAAHTTALGASVTLDLVDRGTTECRSHFYTCGTDMEALNRALG